ncbi:polyphenol oxidase family protein [Bacillus sp. SD088]|uniref:polyphenol oxidase family protein n=1 Tax=Bacillus sp. SD088 TaxID=2782012 RepID=UPI001A95F8BC|nr:polyphenol oxidase family protein [Bacillus sp. SD088]MBO0991894.1 polyphenol oxidase family protein [Bacillus sp. SD088]
MNIKMYINNEKWLAGMTMKDEDQLENFNMALHACQDREAILQNRRQLARFLNCELGDFVCAEQTHSANFHQVVHADKGRGADKLETAVPVTDALYTYEPNILLCSFNADCVPVFFYHEPNGVAGVIHSGWQGTVKEISLKLFKHLIHDNQCDPNGFHVQICPALSQEKFEVDEDVYVQYKDLGYADKWIEYNEQTSKYHIDNQETVKQQCLLAGIPENQIQIDYTCTFQSSDGFSHRQDKQSGRHLCFIMKKEK